MVVYEACRMASRCCSTETPSVYGRTTLQTPHLVDAKVRIHKMWGFRLSVHSLGAQSDQRVCSVPRRYAHRDRLSWGKTGV